VAFELDEVRAVLRSRQGIGARYDAPNAPALELDWARRGTVYFARLLNRMADRELDEPSQLPGVSRRYIVAQIGYHARLLSEIIAWSRSSRDGRLPVKAEVDAEYVRGHVTQPALALRNLFDHSAVHLNVEWCDLSDAQWDASVQDREGQFVAVRETPWHRAVAVWLHAMDLGADGRFSDLPQDLTEALIRNALGRNPQTFGSAVSFSGDKRVTIRNAAGVTVGGR
jgi:maleylpyruvate isomerase